MANNPYLVKPQDDVPWVELAACRAFDPDLFFPEYDTVPEQFAAEEEAKAVCLSCPVREQCEEHALAERIPYGIWGGKTAAERGLTAKRSSSTPVLTEEQQRNVAALFRLGANNIEAAAKVGISRRTCGAYRHALMRSLHADGLPAAEVAAATGFSVQKVSRFFNRQEATP